MRTIDQKIIGIPVVGAIMTTSQHIIAAVVGGIFIGIAVFAMGISGSV